jgi:hypothetical protein
MPAPSPLAPFLDPLERLDLPYCVTGSVAASVYGEPRLTADIDIVLLLRVADIAGFVAAFPESDYYVPPGETLRLELARDTRGMFNLIHHASQFKADIYLAGRDPLHAWALDKRRRIALADSATWIAPPEYVIVRKLEYLREGSQDKHIRDIRFILAESAVDTAFIESEVMRRGLEFQWRAARGAGAR